MRAALSSVDHLASLLAPAVRLGALAMPPAGDIDAVILTLQGHLKSGSAGHVPEADLQFETVQRFWKAMQLPTLKDARLVAFGLGLRAGPEGACLLDDTPRFDALLRGADEWLQHPRWFRRCYQGLLWSYFNVDIDADGATEAFRRNAQGLREYLARRAPKTVDKLVNPDWVKTLLANPHLLGHAPCEPHIAALMAGDSAALDEICARLAINGDSWFLRRLVQAQVTAATRLDHDAFCAQLAPLLGMLGATTVGMRDTGLATLIERYARLPHPALHDGLRDAVTRAWGTPWQPATSTHALCWSGLADAPRELLTAWLKADLIDRFFADPAGALDPRRAVFWKRYAESIQQLERTPDGTALVMTMGRARITAWNQLDAPLQAHDLRRAASIDTDADAAPDLQLPHQDGLDGWRCWEQMFEDALQTRFDLRPGALRVASRTSFVDLADPVEPPSEAAATRREQRWHAPSAREDVHWQTAEAAIVPYSRPDLEVLARVHALRIEDDLMRSGRLWVRTDDSVDARIAQVLRRWGFQQVPGEGWFR
jgi:hypothetical protein